MEIQSFKIDAISSRTDDKQDRFDARNTIASVDSCQSSAQSENSGIQPGLEGLIDFLARLLAEEYLNENGLK
jgi:hypothetical protein